MNIKQRCLIIKYNITNAPRKVIQSRLTNIKKEDTEYDCTCGICMDDTNEKLKSLPCKHSFHKKCITLWIKREIKNNNIPTCPTCRSLIYDNNEIEKIYGTFKNPYKNRNYDNYYYNTSFNSYSSDSDQDHY